MERWLHSEGKAPRRREGEGEKCPKWVVQAGEVVGELERRRWKEMTSTTTPSASSKDGDLFFKFIIIGDTGTGKSCLLRHFVEKKFQKGMPQTIGVEFGSKVINVNGKKVKLQIWDTAGQERFRSVTRSYYRGAVGCILVYDTSNRETYNHLASWLNDARTLARPEISVVVVGNKSDKKNEREVALLEASRFAQEYDLFFVEASALTGEGVDDAFYKCAQSVLGKCESGQLDLNTTTTTPEFDFKDEKSSTETSSTGCAC